MIDSVLSCMFLSVVFLLFLDVEFILAYYLTKKEKWVKGQLIVTVPAVVMSVAGLLISIL